VVGPNQLGVKGSSNNSAAEFLARFDEVLEILDLMPPQDDGGEWYDAWNPPSPPEFARQRVRVYNNYREWLAKALGIKL